MRNARRTGLGRHLAAAVVAGAAVTAVALVQQEVHGDRAGGKDPLPRWELAAGVTTWEEASAPGKVGQKLGRLVTRQPPPDSWARTTTNLVHWATGIGWGIQYGLVASRAARHPVVRAAALGPVVWLTGYALLPLAGVYKPIWEYDAQTLGEDLSAHLVFGGVTAAVFAALT